MKIQLSNALKGAKNIGATIEQRLNEIGVYTMADLAEVTPVEAFKKIRSRYADQTIPVCYYLYSLQGALLDVHWNDLPVDVKEDLQQLVVA